MIEVVTKFPLKNLRRKSVRDVTFKNHGDRLCVIYSTDLNKYKTIDGWDDDPNKAEIKTLSECFESTKDDRGGIIYCAVRF